MKTINTRSDELFKFFVRRMPEKRIISKMKLIALEPDVVELANSIVRVNDEGRVNHQRMVDQILRIEDDIKRDFIQNKNFTSKIKSHRNLIEQIESNGKNNIANISKVMSGFITSENFIADFQRLRLKKLVDFTTWIIKSNNKKLELNDYKNKIVEVFSKSAEELSTSTDFLQDKSNVYNSVLSLSIIDASTSTLRDSLFTLAKTINFIFLLGNHDPTVITENGIENPLDTEIIYPPKIFETDALNTIDEYRIFEEFITEKQKVKVQAQELRNLKSTRKILSKIEDNLVEAARLKKRSKTNSKALATNQNTSSDPNRDNNDKIDEDEEEIDLILTKETIDNLDDISKNTLKDEKISLSNTSVDKVTSQIGKRISEVTLLLYPKLGKAIFKDPDDIIESINDEISNRKKVVDPVVPSMNLDNLTADLDTVQKFPPFVSGIGDLKKVKDKISRYVYGEIAHVENILTGELKERVHKKLTKTEETITIEEKTTEDITNHLESTERFELKKASNEVIETENKIDFGVKITAGYGPFFEASSYFDMGIGSSTKESNDLSSTYSKDVIDKSISKIQRIMSEKRVTKITQQIEETNTHKLDNTTRDFNVHGIYQWLDKIYCGELYVYDKRLLLEFIIYEPARFYKDIFRQSKEKSINLKNSGKVMPDVPEPFFRDEEMKNPIMPEDITEETYTLYASWYDAEINPPPPKYIWLAETFKQDEFIKTKEIDKESVLTFVAERKVVLPEGYKMTKWLYEKEGNGPTGRDIDVRLKPSLSQANLEGTIGIIIATRFYDSYSVVVSILSRRTDNLMNKWKYDTWLKIHEAYLNKKALYDSKMAEMAISEGIEIVGSNPLFNRETEKVELKKGAIMMLTKNPLSTSGAYYKHKVGDYQYPYIDFDMANKLGKQIQFFEQAVEWHNMLYVFYSYFWGKHKEWVENLFLNDIDPLFSNFLKAGAARVVVPVRPGFEKALLYFLKTKIIWEGKDVPLVNEPMYLDIVEEMKEKLDLQNYDGMLQDSWEYKVPTSLVYLRNNDLSDSEENLPNWEGCTEVDNDNIPVPEG